MRHQAYELDRRTALGAAVAAAALGSGSAAAQPATELPDRPVTYRTVPVGDVEVFYREAGPADAPVLLALHGFPTASHMFRNLIPLLADRYRIIAPDLPGFGNTKAPPRGSFAYTFDTLAEVVDGFTDALGLKRYALYIFDYGAPTGLRLAMAHPERVTAIVTQNGNAYKDGFSDNWTDWETYWREPTPAHREACRSALSEATIRDLQYLHGVPDKARVSPDGYTLDLAYLAREGRAEIQLDLILDYRSNVALYPAFQRYLREHRPPMLAAWAGTIRSSSRPAPRLTSATSPTPRCICSTPAISRSRRTPRRSRR